MRSFVLCHDGLNVHLESQDGLWFVLSETDEGSVLGRFAVDPAELRQIAEGGVGFQATDGKGHSLGIEGGVEGITVRLEGESHRAFRCKVQREAFESALRTMNISV